MGGGGVGGCSHLLSFRVALEFEREAQPFGRQSAEQGQVDDDRRRAAGVHDVGIVDEALDDWVQLGGLGVHVPATHRNATHRPVSIGAVATGGLGLACASHPKGKHAGLSGMARLGGSERKT